MSCEPVWRVEYLFPTYEATSKSQISVATNIVYSIRNAVLNVSSYLS